MQEEGKKPQPDWIPVELCASINTKDILHPSFLPPFSFWFVLQSSAQVSGITLKG